jgi:hypothetical protein
MRRPGIPRELQATKGPREPKEREGMRMSFKHSDEPLNRLAYEFLVKAATLVDAPEAAAFSIGDDGENAARGGDLRLLSHIRADDAAPDVRDAAVRAFRQLVQPWVEHDRNAVIKIWDQSTGDAQYCLIARLPDRGRTFAIAALICNCADVGVARSRLNAVRGALATAGK